MLYDATLPYAVKFMAEWCADECLWPHAHYPYDSEYLLRIIPSCVLEDFRYWGHWYEDLDFWTRHSGMKELDAFTVRGQILARRLKGHLPSWKVFFYDEVECWIIDREIEESQGRSFTMPQIRQSCLYEILPCGELVRA